MSPTRRVSTLKGWLPDRLLTFEVELQGTKAARECSTVAPGGGADNLTNTMNMVPRPLPLRQRYLEVLQQVTARHTVMVAPINTQLRAELVLRPKKPQMHTSQDEPTREPLPHGLSLVLSTCP